MRELPAVHALLSDAESEGLLAAYPRGVVVDAIRGLLDEVRSAPPGSATVPPQGGWLDALSERLSREARPAVIPVVNGTGVVLHTNLGRAPLAPAAITAMQGAAGYCSVEYDVALGERGSRQDVVRGLIRKVTGAEDGLAVNNAASALLLVLNTLAEARETLVSRGELVEIGGRFRIPEILAKSGSVLVEVGTTNRTRLSDYERAVSPRSGAVLKVHRSNFRLEGFVSEATVEELCRSFGVRGIPVVHDVGSGLLLSLEEFGFTGEPLVSRSVAAGAVAVFSGDKLMGGPQSGLIAGPRDALQRMAENPLARALRPDKTVLAALEATLRLYLDRDAALRGIPALRMLTAPPAALRDRAERLAALIEGAGTAPGTSSAGGGSFPGVELATTLVTLPVPDPEGYAALLRLHTPPVLARTGQDAISFDVRTLNEDDLPLVAEAVREAGKRARAQRPAEKEGERP